VSAPAINRIWNWISEERASTSAEWQTAWLQPWCYWDSVLGRAPVAPAKLCVATTLHLLPVASAGSLADVQPRDEAAEQPGTVKVMWQKTYPEGT